MKFRRRIWVNKKEESAREEVIRDYLEERTIEIIEKIEELFEKYDKKIAKLF